MNDPSRHQRWAEPGWGTEVRAPPWAVGRAWSDKAATTATWRHRSSRVSATSSSLVRGETEGRARAGQASQRAQRVPRRGRGAGWNHSSATRECCVHRARGAPEPSRASGQAKQAISGRVKIQKKLSRHKGWAEPGWGTEVRVPPWAAGRTRSDKAVTTANGGTDAHESVRPAAGSCSTVFWRLRPACHHASAG